MSTVSAASPAPLLSRVDGVGAWLAPLGLRVLLAWEFFEAGREKLQGENWFAELADKFPLPFSLLGANVNWTLATWTELLGSIALLIGLGTRYAAATLFVVTVVAIHAVHWPSEWSSLAELWQGYAISNDGYGNYKLPLIYLAMLLPLMFGGAGRLSVDHLIASRRASTAAATPDTLAWGVVLFAIGTTVSLLLPWAGAALAVSGVALMAWPRRRRTASELLAAA
ncbi:MULTISPECIES: DoxX family protein [unclassified Lysobacter]|uniref:HvfX family Cu-binding RiPP maturation protein n=1 Tax=unclassified Lysobacter TaxID=2635362 RepID=UPI001C234873|nr:DoxX family protein [Lysobacter sp. MMG2]MBU8977845.1 DoxX family protein [Lysobacter sp. MMG2]